MEAPPFSWPCVSGPVCAVHHRDGGGADAGSQPAPGPAQTAPVEYRGATPGRSRYVVLK